MIYKFSEFKSLIIKYERHLSALALAVGFIIDSLTLKRIDTPYENFVLMVYFILAGGCIALLHLYDNKRESQNIISKYSFILPIVIQFALGGLYSGFTVFYSRSGSLFSSWPFLLLLLFLLVGNEIFRKHYERLAFQVGTFFTALFFYFIFFIPVHIGKMGPGIFLLSGFVSLVAISGFVYLLYFISSVKIKNNLKIITKVILCIYVFINILYFTNVIPPIPLSLKDAGVYHHVVQKGDDFIARGENVSWLKDLLPYETVHIAPGDRVYAFSAVFAPTDLSIKVVHNWQYFDEYKKRWVSMSRIPFRIIGGSDGGYRGFSYKTATLQGRWRVDVETERNQVIGRIMFDIVYTDEKPNLLEKNL
jgi:hypothetical protein